MHALVSRIMVLLCALLSISTARAQTCGHWISGPGVGGNGGGVSGVSGEITALVAFDPDDDGPLGTCVAVRGNAYAGGNQLGATTWDGSRWVSGLSPWVSLFPNGIGAYLGKYHGNLIGFSSGTVVERRQSTWISLGGVFNGGINATVELNGNLVVGGTFTAISGASIDRLAMWDGVRWSSFSYGLGGAISAMTVWNGSVVVGGRLTIPSSPNIVRVARWDGSRWSALGTNLGGYNVDVRVLTVFNGDLVMSGPAPVVNWMTSGTVSRLVNGLWVELGADQLPRPRGAPSSLVEFQGKLFTGGEFYGPVSLTFSLLNDIFSWDGTVWTEHAEARLPGAAGYAFAVRDSELVVGRLGWFPYSSTQGFNAVRRFDGTRWLPAGSGMDGPVTLVQDLGGGRAAAAGQFAAAGGQYVEGLALWNGAAWEPMDAGLRAADTGASGPPSITGMAVFQGQPVVIGRFSNVNGDPTVNRVASWNGSRWSPISSSSSFGTATPLRVCATPGALFVARTGQRNISSTSAEYFIEVVACDGLVWTPIPGRLNVNTTGAIPVGIDMLSLGSSIVVFGVSNVDGVTYPGAAIWNGSGWLPLPGHTASGEVLSHPLMHNGHLVASGFVTLYQWDGAVWSPLTTPLQYSPAAFSALASFEGDLWATRAGGSELQRWDGQDWRAVGGGPVFPDAMWVVNQELWVEDSHFEITDGRVVGGLARWSSTNDGQSIIPTAWQLSGRTGRSAVFPFAIVGTGPFAPLRMHKDGTTTPWPTSYSSRLSYSIAPWGTREYLTGAIVINSLQRADAGVYTFDFRGPCGEIQTSSVTLQVACSADFDQNGTIDIYDLTAYLDAWFARNPAAQMTPVSGVYIADLLAWLSVWLQGC